MSARRVLFATVLLAACTASPPMDPHLATVPAASGQALVVRAVAAGSSRATVAAFERTPAGWREVIAPLPAMVGRSGIVAGAEKREGDGHTPGGVHRLGTAFGYAPTGATKLAWRQATADDWWVDEATSPDYNHWVTGKPPVSAEAMRRGDGQYELGAVLEWNTAPVVPGRGSAIFLHVWQAPGEPTSGCVALARADVARLLAWLDAARAPVVVVVP